MVIGQMCAMLITRIANIRKWMVMDEHNKCILFEKGCGKWIELVDEGQAKFHSSEEFATIVDLDVVRSSVSYESLLSRHRILYLRDTITFDLVETTKNLGEKIGPRF